MKKLSLTDITLLAIAVCLILVLTPVLIRLRQSTTVERDSRRIRQEATTTTLPVATSDMKGNRESLPAKNEVEKEEKIPPPPKGEKPILMY